MSVSPIPGNAAPAQANSGNASSRAADTASPISDAGDTAQASTSAQPPASPPAPSTIVTLSPEAQALSTLASKGITVTQSSLQGITLPKNFTKDDLTQFAKEVARVAVTPPTDGKKTIGVVSEDDFAKVALHFNTTQEGVSRLFQDLDGDHDHLISNGELLDSLAKLGQADGGDSTQTLLQLMNTNGDGTVDDSELIKFETAFVAAEKPRT